MLDQSHWTALEGRARDGSRGSELPSSCRVEALQRPSLAVVTKTILSTERLRQRKKEIAGKRDLRELLREDIETLQQMQMQLLQFSHPLPFFVYLLSDPRSLSLTLVIPSEPEYTHSSVELPPITNKSIGKIIANISAKRLEDAPISPKSEEMRSNMLKRVYIISLLVTPEFEGQGIGRELFMTVLHRLCARSPLVAVSNTSSTPMMEETQRVEEVLVSLHCDVTSFKAINFYASLGMTERDVVRGYYRTSSGIGDAVLLEGLVKVYV